MISRKITESWKHKKFSIDFRIYLCFNRKKKKRRKSPWEIFTQIPSLFFTSLFIPQSQIWRKRKNPRSRNNVDIHISHTRIRGNVLIKNSFSLFLHSPASRALVHISLVLTEKFIKYESFARVFRCRIYFMINYFGLNLN